VLTSPLDLAMKKITSPATFETLKKVPRRALGARKKHLSLWASQPASTRLLCPRPGDTERGAAAQRGEVSQA
jgi:hypothetical protein